MQTGFTGFVDRSEWRWVLSVSIAFVLMTLVPYLIVWVFGSAPQQNQFMGLLHDHMDTASSLARMQQGANSDILVDFAYSSATNQTPALMQPIYSLLGQLTAFTQLSVTTLFHVMRIFVSLYMYITLYYLGASIWVKPRPRRIFFIVTSLGTGFGWLLAPLFTGTTAPVIPDLNLPQAFPFYATAANLHYPLAISCIAVIVAIMIAVLRPGEQSNPSTENGGTIVFIASLVLAFIYPDALLPIGLAYILNVCFNWYAKKSITRLEWYWGLWILVPALPVITYNAITLMNNPHVGAWVMQRQEIPSLLFLLASLGLPLIIAIPAIWRAIRRFEPDGDRLMLLWLVVMIITMYLPVVLDQYVLLGLMIPIGYFATRASEDYWFKAIRRMHRPRIYPVVLTVMILSHSVWMFFPVYPILAGWTGINAVVLENEYTEAFSWLAPQVDNNTVILASPDVSLWIPVRTNAHVVYGHPAETIDAEETLEAVTTWYGQADTGDCQALLDTFEVDYVIHGIRETKLGNSSCLEILNPVATFETVTIYETQVGEE
ncbi:MAG: hypothetical protein AAF846_19615 [Chloroflexota bacterium]